MLKRFSKYFITIFLGTLLISSGTSFSSGQGVDFRIPELEVEEFSYDLNDNYDVYVQNEQYHQIVDHTFDFSPATTVQTDFFEENRNVDPFVGISQFLNDSVVTSEQKLEYKRNYFNLFDNTTESVDKIFLAGFQDYLFTYNVLSENVYSPMFFEFLFSQVDGGSTFGLDIIVVDPLGVTDDIQNIRTTKDLKQLIPFLPKIEGTHVFSVRPRTNVVLSGMDVNLSPEIINPTSGYSARLQGDNTISKIFKMESVNGTNIVSWNAIEFQKEYYIDETNILTFGRSQTYTFGRVTGGLFGDGNTAPLPNDDIFEIYVITPADPADVLNQKARKDGTYNRGMDFELTLTTQNSPISPLVVNENFDSDIVDAYSKVNAERIYRYETSETVLITVNSSTTNDADIKFSSNDPSQVDIFVNPIANDVLNVNGHDFVVIPAGVYTVFIPVAETFRISILSFTPLNIDQTTTLVTTFDDVHFFELPSSGFVEDLFNVTYLDMVNETISFDWTIYNADGTVFDNSNFDLEHYYLDTQPGNGVTLTLQDNNITEFAGGVNLVGGYLKLVVDGNSKWDGTTGKEIDNNNSTRFANVTLSRLNAFTVAQQLNPADLYYLDTLGTSINHNFLVANDTVINYFDLTTSADTVYRLTIDVTNRTLADFDLDLGGGNVWYKNLKNDATPVNISGFDHYILTIEFLTTTPVLMGMILTLGTENLNGTYSITLEQFTYTEIGLIVLPGLNINDLGTILADDDDDGSIFSNPLFWAAGLGGVAIIAVAAILFKRKT